MPLGLPHEKWRSGARPTLLKAGDVLCGKYRVERLLGEGGMGMVVAAHHLMLDQTVAIKLLFANDDEGVSRLLAEARSAARIGGEHVARVIDVDLGDNGLPFIVMELLEGTDLGELLAASGPVPRWQVVDYVLQALEGLSRAHVRNIIHRDLKPSNLFLAVQPDGREVVKILDFGVSKSLAEGAAQGLTGAGAVLGSPPYMSPEQVRSPKSVDRRTDIWALGVVLYELLTGQLPFYGEELQETFAQILEQPVPPIRSYAQGVPEGLEEVILRCLAKNREQRFENVHELAKALVPFGSGAWGHLEGRIGQILARPPEENLAPAYTPASGASLVASARSSQNHLLPKRETDTVTASTVIGRQSFITKEKGSNVFAYVLLGMAVVMLFAAVGVGLKARRGTVAEQSRDLPLDTSTALPPGTAGQPPTLAPQPPPPTTVVLPAQPVLLQPAGTQLALGPSAPTAATPVMQPPQAMPPVPQPTAVAQPKVRPPAPNPQAPPPSTAPAPKASGKLPSQLLGRGD